MRFLIDVQLPPFLAERLKGVGFDAVHADELGMATASDAAIWTRALSDKAVLVTKDIDFVVMASRARHSPQLVWVRTGNTSNRVLWATFERLLPQLIASLQTGEKIVTVR